MAGNKAISSGNRVEKQKQNNCDELIRGFHKKLNIECKTETPSEVNLDYASTSTALILYKVPSLPSFTEKFPQEIMKSLRLCPSIPQNQTLLFPKSHFNIETVFQVQVGKNSEKLDESINETVLD